MVRPEMVALFMFGDYLLENTLFMEYIKLFENHNAYQQYRNSAAYYKTPNVSYCLSQNHVHFDEHVDIDPFNGYSYVDLGMNGLLWATANIGAISEIDAGLYFQWGDTVGYSASQIGSGEGQKMFNQDFSDYKYAEYNQANNEYVMTKYNQTDELVSLETTDDAARVIMGGKWRLPTESEYEQLLAINPTWTSRNGVNGFEFVANNGNSLFFPVTNIALDGTIEPSNMSLLWASERMSENEENAFLLQLSNQPFDQNVVNSQIVGMERCIGLPIRAVIKPND